MTLAWIDGPFTEIADVIKTQQGRAYHFNFDSTITYVAFILLTRHWVGENLLGFLFPPAEHNIQREKGQGDKGGPGPAVMKKHEDKKGDESLAWEKSKNFGFGQDI